MNKLIIGLMALFLIGSVSASYWIPAYTWDTGYCLTDIEPNSATQCRRYCYFGQVTITAGQVTQYNIVTEDYEDPVLTQAEKCGLWTCQQGWYKRSPRFVGYIQMAIDRMC